MRVTGKVSAELKFATEFFLQQLIKDGRIRRHVDVEIILDSSLDGFAGLTASDDPAKTVKPKYFTVRLNPVAGDCLYQSLAHECVHIKQYALGELEDHLDGKIIWKGQMFTGQVAYGGELEDAPPWEEEAYSLEIDLMDEYLALEVL